MALFAAAQHIERRVKIILRGVDMDALPAVQRAIAHKLQLAAHEVKLDVRDYEYAETRAEQMKWRRLARHNIAVFEALLIELGDIFGPADVAELGAQLQLLQSNLE